VLRAFSQVEAAAVIAQAADSPLWSAATVNATLDVDPSIRDAELLAEPAHPHALVYRDRLAVITERLAGALAPKSTLSELHLVRYRAGGQYVDHRDTPLEGGTPRVLSILCYLNDDFQGGATAFPDLDFAFEPVAGTAIVFPPTYLHRAEPIASGEKYVITAWYHV
jgi:predicted 2-oxoglutarate/Fe(II)-dependent dioxygenase YbiX